jgi:hypothetical protein
MILPPQPTVTKQRCNTAVSLTCHVYNEYITTASRILLITPVTNACTASVPVQKRSQKMYRITANKRNL